MPDDLGERSFPLGGDTLIEWLDLTGAEFAPSRFDRDLANKGEGNFDYLLADGPP